MIGTVLVTAAIALLAMLPGPILLRGAAPKPGQWAAAATASLVAVMLATALLGELVSLAGFSLSSATMIPVSLLGCGASWFATRGQLIGKPGFEWPAFVLAVLFAGYGLLCQTLAVHDGADGALMVHVWFNADWFKHLGHVAALADHGVPARDVFNNGEPLYYYWLSYVLPGAGAALGGDNWAALNTANAIITALFCATFYGAVRMTGAGPRTALLVCVMCLFVWGPIKFAWSFLADPAALSTLLDSAHPPAGAALTGLSRYVPQHALALTLMLSWIVLNQPESRVPRAVNLLMLAALASVLAISTMLGAMVLAVYGLAALWTRHLRAVPEVAIMAVLSALLVVALGVIQIGNPTSAVASPLLDNPVVPAPLLTRAFNSTMLIAIRGGLPFLIGLGLLYAWRGRDYAFRLAAILYVVAIASVVAAEAVLPPRVAIETVLRAVNLPALAFALTGAWAIARFWQKNRTARIAVTATAAFLVLAALPALVLQTIWFGRNDPEFITVVPRDDRQVLAWLHDNSPPRTVVWQYPELPFLANPPGGDAWAAVLAGRTVTGSLRATDYASSVPRIEAAKRWFSGGNVPIPADLDWIYLSRKLHPASYDALLVRLEKDTRWLKRECRQDACVFERRDAARYPARPNSPSPAIPTSRASSASSAAASALSV